MGLADGVHEEGVKRENNNEELKCKFLSWATRWTLGLLTEMENQERENQEFYFLMLLCLSYLLDIQELSSHGLNIVKKEISLKME